MRGLALDSQGGEGIGPQKQKSKECFLRAPLTPTFLFRRPPNYPLLTTPQSLRSVSLGKINIGFI